MPEQFTNFARTTLAASLAQSANSATVSDGSRFPLANFHVVIEYEIVYVTLRSGNSLTGLLRGQKGTSDVGHGNGVTVVASPILAHHLQELYAMTAPNVVAQVWRSTGQTAPTNTDTVVSYDTAIKDTNGMWSSSTPTRLTAKTPGTYIFHGYLDAGTGASRYAYLRKNGTQLIALSYDQGDTIANEHFTLVSPPVDMAAGDYVEMAMYHDAGADRTIGSATPSGGGARKPTLSAHMVSGGAQPNTPTARISRNTTTTVGTAWTDIPLPVLIWDSDGMFDSTNGRLVCKTAGKYSFQGNIGWAATTGKEMIAGIAVNGVRIAHTGPHTPSSVHGLNQNVHAEWDLNVGDVVTLQGYATVSATVAAGASTRTDTDYTSLTATMVPGGLARNTTPPAGVTAGVRTSANVGVNNTTWTAIPFASADWDTDALWSSAAPTRLTARRDGKYLITGNATFASSASGRRLMAIWKNTLTQYGRIEASPSSTGDFSGTTSAVLDLKAGDYVEFIVYQSSGGALNVTTNGDYSGKMEMTLLSGSPDGVASSVRAVRTSAYSVGNGGYATIPFESIGHDTDQMWSSATPSRVTIKTAGVYNITTHLVWAPNGTGHRAVGLHLNSVYVQEHNEMAVTSGGAGTVVTMTTTLSLKVGDYLEIGGWQNSGAALNVIGGSLTATLATSPTRGSQSPPNNIAGRTYKNATQSIPSGGWTKLTWEVTEFDTDNCVDLVNDRLVARTPGKYDVVGVALVAANATGQRVIGIRKNGVVTGIVETQGPNQSALTSYLLTNTLVDMAAGDYLELWVFQNSGSNLLVDNLITHFAMSLVSGTVNPVAPGARVYRATNTSALTNGTATTLTWDGERWDTDNIFDPTTSTSRLTCRTAGVYNIFTNVTWSANSTGRRMVQLLLNGTRVIAEVETLTGTAAEFTQQNLSCVEKLAVGDYIEVVAAQASGTGLSIVQSSSVNATEFGMAMAAPYGQQTSASWSQPRGIIGGTFDKQKSGGANALSAGTTEFVQYAPGPVTLEPGRTYRISGYWTRGGGSDGYVNVSLRRGAGSSTPTTSSTWIATQREGKSGTADLQSYAFSFIDQTVPSAGTYRYALTFQASAGVYDIYEPYVIIIEDMGGIP